jgi:hypothetical protein
VAQADLELELLLPQSPRWLGSQVCATVPAPVGCLKAKSPWCFAVPQPPAPTLTHSRHVAPSAHTRLADIQSCERQKPFFFINWVVLGVLSQYKQTKIQTTDICTQMASTALADSSRETHSVYNVSTEKRKAWGAVNVYNSLQPRQPGADKSHDKRQP